jgi:NAD(P)-dependent dehydrogenase (short-subunit alcohol dehydrogenase family)
MTNNTLTQKNVKSVIIAATALLPTANKKYATMLGVIAGALVLPPASKPGLSAYLNSKMAMVKTLEFLAVENPGVFVASVHPGMVDTALFRKSGATPEMLPMDSGEFVYMPLLNCMECLECILFLALGPHD